jgi:hypothetical protein
MKKTSCHVYHFHDIERDVVEIYSIGVLGAGEDRLCRAPLAGENTGPLVG